MRVLELRCDLDLPLEALTVHSGGQLRREDFDDYLSSQGMLGRGEYATHPAAYQLVVDAVGGGERGSESVAEGVSHGVRTVAPGQRGVRSTYVEAASRVTPYVRHSGPSHRFVVDGFVTDSEPFSNPAFDTNAPSARYGVRTGFIPERSTGKRFWRGNHLRKTSLSVVAGCNRRGAEAAGGRKKPRFRSNGRDTGG